MLVVSVLLPLVRAIAVGCLLPLPIYTSFSNSSVIYNMHVVSDLARGVCSPCYIGHSNTRLLQCVLLQLG